MPTAAVAGRGDVTTIVGKRLPPPATKGMWTAGVVEETVARTLEAGGGLVLHEATCVFNFTGTTDPPASTPVSATSTVKLSARESRLLVGGKGVLLHGGSAEDSFGNKLQATSSRPLRSS
ncbi:hypothetical protein [Streptomyces sp. DASNCL29]|uniref:hypothetical protein n=1 Tax=Streptomyces sp. DASNCL29 TaxID=2583819 RepID=UPI00110FA21C|nr:hypothetical protein [Streptomyces sp. DASNCL29]TMV00040.1 hypothetical protein FGK60_21825 [Streptomyces sp. DASNCL29]